jgi:crotonobetainyl-CoA:carnitine CoA-transferase CaiB-like acyl-CoA transferase
MLAAGVCAAIAQRAMTGKASVVDGSLLAASLWSMQSKITSSTLAGVPDLYKQTRTSSPNPLVNCYRTSDERFVVICMLQPQRFWAGFCRALGRPELADDPRFNSDESRKQNILACIETIDEMFAAKTLEECREALSTQPGQWDVVQQPGELHADVQVQANQFMQDVGYGDGRVLKMVSVPVQFDREVLKARPAPEFGADGDAILSGLGYTEDEIIDLRVAGVMY